MNDISTGWIAPPLPLIYGVIGLLFVSLVLLGLAVSRLLRRAGQWSLAEALSEPAEFTEGPGAKTSLVASSSRLIAFLGMVAILALFLGFGAFVLWGVAVTGHPPQRVEEFSKFLLGGVTLFAPYVVNKCAAAFTMR